MQADMVLQRHLRLAWKAAGLICHTGHQSPLLPVITSSNNATLTPKRPASNSATPYGPMRTICSQAPQEGKERDEGRFCVSRPWLAMSPGSICTSFGQTEALMVCTAGHPHMGLLSHHSPFFLYTDAF